ncbi:MAG: cupin domain-containing protein [Pseudomonadales bacterium]|nr:cupin domain-containing protein [Pseudomonadales bacterium]
MKNLGLLVLLIAAIAAAPVQAAPGVLPLKVEELKLLKLDSIPPWPAEMVLKGTNEHWQKVLHQGEFVVTIYEAQPALIDISTPYPYDEFVLVLEGEVTLSATEGEKRTYRAGDSFVVPKGFTGTWNMPVKFREMIIVETRAWLASGEASS